jgi:hypothetical protein
MFWCMLVSAFSAEASNASRSRRFLFRRIELPRRHLPLRERLSRLRRRRAAKSTYEPSRKRRIHVAQMRDWR